MKSMYTLKIATKEFMDHNRFEKNLSEQTIKAYSIDLKQLWKFLSERKYSIDVSHITKIELREYLETISTLKPKSIKRKVATIKALFNYLEFEDKIVVNPLRKMRIRIRSHRELPRVLDINEMGRIFSSAYNENQFSKANSEYSQFERMRNAVVVELLFTTGARVSEISGLKDNYIDLSTGSVTIKGKGNKERIIQICNPETIKILKNYRKLFQDRIFMSGGYFLVNRLNKRLSEQSIRTIVKTLSNSACIQKNVTPHVFRHSFATLLLEKDVDIKYIQSMLGHSSIMTTQIYTHVNREKQRQILKAKHPRKDFSMQTPC